MSLKVYYTYGNPRGTKIIVAAELANVNIEHINLTKDLLKKEEHLKRFLILDDNIGTHSEKFQYSKQKVVIYLRVMQF